jgi:putative membrane protein
LLFAAFILLRVPRMKTLIGIATLILAPALAFAGGGDKAAKTTLSDGNVVAIASTARQGEIDVSQIAIGKATNPDVKTFASMMVADHGAALEKAKALGIAPEENEESKKMKADAMAAGDKLKALSGADFDKAYLTQMIADHKAVLTALDKKLIPNAKNSALKQHLKDFRPKAAEHLKHAEELSKKLASPTPAATN